MRDCSVLVGLQHENLSPVIATCLDAPPPPLGRPLKLVYLASSDDDNLKLYLQQCRHSQVPARPPASDARSPSERDGLSAVFPVVFVFHSFHRKTIGHISVGQMSFS